MQKLSLLGLIFVFWIASMNTVSATSSTSYQISVNGQIIEADASPINLNGAILVPMRAIFEALNATVSFLKNEQKVVGQRGNTTLEMWLGQNEAYLNGEEVTIPQAPIMLSNRVYVPVRIISEALGANIKWNKATQTVEIESTLLTHHDKLPIANDRGRNIVLEHNGNMSLKWSYQDESPFEMFYGYVAGENSFIFKGHFEAYMMDRNGEITEHWELNEHTTPSIKAYYFHDSKTAKIVSSNPEHTWSSIPILRNEFDFRYTSSSVSSIDIIEPVALIDRSGNLIVATAEGLTAYAPDGQKLWSHKEWNLQDQTISAQQYAYKMMYDELGRLFIFYLEHTIILDEDGKLLTSVKDSFFNLYPLQDGRILSDRGIYEITESGHFRPVFQAAITDVEYIHTTEQSITKLGMRGEEVEWSYHLANFELNKGQRIFESSLTKDQYGNTYFSAQNGSVYAFNNKGELIFKLVIDQRTLSVSEIIPLSEHELIIVNDNAILFFNLQ